MDVFSVKYIEELLSNTISDAACGTGILFATGYEVPVLFAPLLYDTVQPIEVFATPDILVAIKVLTLIT